MNKSEYQTYLRSPHWYKTRNRRLSVAGYRCEFRPITGGEDDMKHGPYYGDRCEKKSDLEVHHLHYQSLGAEKDSDLEVLCRFHHLVREAVGSLDCPQCGDGPMQYEEEDIIECVGEVIAEAGGINKVDLSDIRDRCSWFIHCSYCSR